MTANASAHDTLTVGTEDMGAMPLHCDAIFADWLFARTFQEPRGTKGRWGTTSPQHISVTVSDRSSPFPRSPYSLRTFAYLMCTLVFLGVLLPIILFP